MKVSLLKASHPSPGLLQPHSNNSIHLLISKSNWTYAYLRCKSYQSCPSTDPPFDQLLHPARVHHNHPPNVSIKSTCVRGVLRREKKRVTFECTTPVCTQLQDISNGHTLLYIADRIATHQQKSTFNAAQLDPNAMCRTQNASPPPTALLQGSSRPLLRAC